MPNEKSQVASKIIIVFLLMVFIFALGNLIFNIENLYIEGEFEPDFYRPEDLGGGNVATNPTLADALRYAWFGALGICILAVIISIYSFMKSENKGKWKRLMIKIVGTALVSLIVGAVLFTHNNFEAESGSGANPVLSDSNPVDGNNGNASGGGEQNNTREAPDAMRVLIMFTVFMAGFGILALFIAGAITFMRMKHETLKYHEHDESMKEVAESIQRAIDTLYQGTDPRSTIIRCYNDLCKIMERSGIREQEFLTPREFEALARDNLPVSDVHLHNLVLVFEEARYSDHEMSEKEAKRALVCLERVKKDMEKRVEGVDHGA